MFVTMNLCHNHVEHSKTFAFMKMSISCKNHHSFRTPSLTNLDCYMHLTHVGPVDFIFFDSEIAGVQSDKLKTTGEPPKKAHINLGEEMKALKKDYYNLLYNITIILQNNYRFFVDSRFLFFFGGGGWGLEKKKKNGITID